MYLKYSMLALLLVFTTQSVAEPMAIMTGGKTGTYIEFGKNIASISEKNGVPILVKPSKGSIDNIKSMMSRENAGFAIVQSDVLGYLTKSKNPKYRAYARNLRLIFPFYNEEVHLLARKEIKSIHDLQGKTVVVGPKSSGTNMTAWNILKMTGITPAKRLHVDINDGIKLVLKNEADAVFVVAGKPRPGFSNLFNTPKSNVKAMLQKVHFVPLDGEVLLREYKKSNLTKRDYPQFMNNSVPTIAVKALLVSFDFSKRTKNYHQQRCRQLYQVAQAIRKNIGKLQNDSKYHPKWKQVNLNGDMEGWTADKCSHSKQLPRKSTIDDDLECSFNGTCK